MTTTNLLAFLVGISLVLLPLSSEAAATPQEHEEKDSRSDAAEAITFARWSHATNTREKLSAALSGDQPVFVEADVMLAGGMPVLMPPPYQLWEVTLNELLYQVTEKPKRVTLKLNLRSNEVLPQAFSVLMVALTENLLDLWLHADVLSGSGGKAPVDAGTFLRQSAPFHPFAVISLGWNTKPKGQYSWSQVESMVRLVRCGYPYLSRIAFKVRASMVENSLAQLSWLLDVLPNATLAIFSLPGEPQHTSALLSLRRLRPTARIVYDLPQEHQLENLLEEVGPEDGGAKAEQPGVEWEAEESNTGSCRKASLPGRNAVVLGDNGVSMVLPDWWSNLEAKLDLSKPRSLAVSMGEDKLSLEGACFQLVMNRSGQEVTSRAWPTTCKNHGSSSSKKGSGPEMVKQWTYGEPAPLKLQSSPGAVVYAVRLQEPAAAAALPVVAHSLLTILIVSLITLDMRAL